SRNREGRRESASRKSGRVVFEAIPQLRLQNGPGRSVDTAVTSAVASKLGATAFSLTSLAVVAATAFAAPLLIELLPGVRLPNVVAEIGLGILVGPSVLGWAHADEPVQRARSSRAARRSRG